MCDLQSSINILNNKSHKAVNNHINSKNYKCNNNSSHLTLNNDFKTAKLLADYKQIILELSKKFFNYYIFNIKEHKYTELSYIWI